MSVDRLKELNKIADKLEATEVYKKKVWLLMDKNRKIIAKGVPRNRWICLVDDPKDRKRVLTYNSKGSASGAGLSSGFYVANGIREYIQQAYPDKLTHNSNGGFTFNYRDIMEAVEATISIKVKK